MGGSNSKTHKMWKEVMDQTAKQTAEVQKEVLKKVASDVKEAKKPDKDEMAKVAAEKAKQFETEGKEILLKVYETYDENHDGILDKTECKKLLKESLIEQKKYVPKLIDIIVDSGMEAAMIAIRGMADSRHLSADEVAQAKKIVQTKMEQIKKDAKALVAKAMEEMIKDADNLAIHLFEKMDLDHNGKVDKSEFMETYSKASKEICNVQEVVSQMQAA